MKTEGEDLPRSQRVNANKARAMTRAINMVSEEFIENFSQTGKDDGPEMPAKVSPVREALAARERRESAAEQKAQDKPEFRGFAALMANANGPAKVSAFARLLEDDCEPAPAAVPGALSQPSAPPTPGAAASVGPETTADGAIIKVKDTVGKKRGLYTSCMQRPTAEQMQEAAVNFAKSTGKPGPVEITQEAAPSPFQRPGAPAFATPAAMPTASAPSYPAPPTIAPESKPIAASPFARPTSGEQAYQPQAYPAAATASPAAPSAAQSFSQGKEVPGRSAGVKRPVSMQKSKMTEESTCPIACSLGKMSGWVGNLITWCKNKFQK